MANELGPLPELVGRLRFNQIRTGLWLCYGETRRESWICISVNVVPGGGSYWNYHASRLREPLSGLSPSKTQPSSQMISGTAIRLLYGRLLSRKRRLVDDAHGEVFRRAHRTEASGLVCAYARTFSPRNHEAPTGREDSPRGGDTR